VDGFYSFVCQTQFSVTGNYNNQFMQALTITSKRLGATVQLAENAYPGGAGAANEGQMNLPFILPFQGGDSFQITVFQNGGAVTTAGANLTWIGGVWCAPYNTYSSAAGGN
jgi:hypothetical protein